MDAEVPAGTINGTNATFVLSTPPNPGATVQLAKNGILLQQNSGYTLNGSTITFASSVVPQAQERMPVNS
ncbi:MAG: hypothetical protein JO061_02430 [Acidobacteriaceae bacterium]|nr:hypothetical protein [Acidobacteriaceae bacterium]